MNRLWGKKILARLLSLTFKSVLDGFGMWAVFDGQQLEHVFRNIKLLLHEVHFQHEVWWHSSRPGGLESQSWNIFLLTLLIYFGFIDVSLGLSLRSDLEWEFVKIMAVLYLLFALHMVWPSPLLANNLIIGSVHKWSQLAGVNIGLEKHFTLFCPDLDLALTTLTRLGSISAQSCTRTANKRNLHHKIEKFNTFANAIL